MGGKHWSQMVPMVELGPIFIRGILNTHYAGT
jgi:hypothetical protein